ncbi:organic cation transporter protein-like [Mizuhopecten yessoensis]|uniref:Organic cation transporter protein n=1 Tax=Mizuhopecten yessoensis TaxID=6573 RepID=A0A210QQB6_MIZYE|nr:organic cation transporter protein-like [Mizuhopecten yessoensis]XP_021352579.1 organic cation transporter protein-like [Mizuhopecten yessoensis]XP_021352580.1 organic cation transporter protein-like [Mizuhopecten yessoensis]OWF50931.1 Organic cation transporter protein [Mizuhopecten yessoensis]
MHFDDLLLILGGFGRYQKIRLFLICLVGILCAFHAMNMVFVGAKPGYQCRIGQTNLSRKEFANTTFEDWERFLRNSGKGCSIYSPSQTYDLIVNGNLTIDGSKVTGDSSLSTESCTDWEYSQDVYGPTIVSEFDLVCSQAWLRSTAKTLYFFGRVIGSVVFGQLSDIFGRKPMFLSGLLSLLVAGCVASAAPSMAVFIPFYILQGAAQTGLYLVAFTMCTELVAPQYRVMAGFMIQGFYSIGYMALSLMSYYIRHWRYIELVITLPVVLFSVYLCILPESIRWLLSKNKIEDATTIIKNVARVNNVELTDTMLENLNDEKEQAEVADGRKYTFIDLFRPLPMLAISINVWFNWFVNAMVYYGLSLGTGNLGGDPYINFCIAGAVEIPAYVLCVLFLNKLGRRWPLCGTMVVGGLSCIVSGFVPSDLVAVKVTFAMIGKFGITASYAIIYLMTAEVFPTVVRNAGMGVSSMTAKIGGMLAPIILELRLVWIPLPLVLFGILSVLAGALALILPETAGKPLPQTIEETISNKSKKVGKEKGDAMPTDDGKNAIC